MQMYMRSKANKPNKQRHHNKTQSYLFLSHNQPVKRERERERERERAHLRIAVGPVLELCHHTVQVAV